MAIYQGDNGPNALIGSELADTLLGYGGVDALYGNGGKDILAPGVEAGVLDTVNGGADFDIVTYAGATGVVVDLETNGTNGSSSNMNDQLSSIEGVFGSSGQDTIRGSSGYNELFGFGGDDKVFGEAGDDKVSGGDGKDQVNGGAGADSMSGGAHADRFIYKSLDDSTAAVHDTLVDFSHAQKDKIDLSGIDANPNKSGNQAFEFIGDDGFTDPGQVHYLHVGSSSVVQVNTDNDTAAEMEIWVSGGPNLVKGDFVL